MLLGAISIIIGYLLGSVSPSYILGKLLKGIDIREHGDGNAGTTNTKKVLGIGPAIIAAIYDLGKGLLSIWIAYKLGADPVFMYAAGYAAILGHVFPFYLGFRGGQGVATAVGILFLNLFLLLKESFLPFEDLLVLVILVLGLLYITKEGAVIGIVALPGFAYFMFKNYPLDLITITTGIIILYILAINIINIYRKKLFRLKPKFHRTVKLWRLLSRPAALVFPIFLMNFDKKITLILVGAVLLAFGIWDIVRLLHSKVNIFFAVTKPGFFKKSEQKRFSTMTLFLLASFLIILIFSKPIAVTAMVFLIFGDMASKFFGIQYGRTKLFHKTLEGTIAYFIVCFVAGYFLLDYFPDVSLVIILVGALAGAVAEVLPLGVDDNLSAGVISAAAMLLTHKFI